jgi:MFS family permease
MSHRAFEAGFFAGVVFYLTLFYTRGELGFRLAIFFGSALLAAAFSGLISFGVFQINHPEVKGWMWLFIIEGTLTVLIGLVAYWWLPSSPETAWFLNTAERTAAKNRSLRDGSKTIGSHFNLKAAFRTWRGWRFGVWCVICFTYPVAFSITSNFLPQVSRFTFPQGYKN